MFNLIARLFAFNLIGSRSRVFYLPRTYVYNFGSVRPLSPTAHTRGHTLFFSFLSFPFLLSEIPSQNLYDGEYIHRKILSSKKTLFAASKIINLEKIESVVAVLPKGVGRGGVILLGKFSNEGVSSPLPTLVLLPILPFLFSCSAADREGSLRCCVTDDLDHRPHAPRSINDFVPLDRRAGWGSVSRFETSPRIQRRASPINDLFLRSRVSFLPLLVSSTDGRKEGNGSLFFFFSVRANQTFSNSALVKWNSLPFPSLR